MQPITAVNPVPQGINAPALFNGAVRNLAGPPRVANYPISGSSPAIRHMDPVTISSGQITRATASSATLLGFAQIGNVRPEIAQIPTMPFDTQTVSGITYTMGGVFVGGSGNEFIGEILWGQTTALTQIGAACDIVPAVVAPTPTLTTNGTAGATTRYYTVVPVTILGEAIGPSGTAITTANAALSATNSVNISIPYVAGATLFNIYRGTSSSNGTLIQTIVQTGLTTGSTTLFVDTGYASQGAAYVVSTTDNCGWMINPASDSHGVVTIRSFIGPVGQTSAVPNSATALPVLCVFVITPTDSSWT
jgi:hypothetical protein